MQTLISFIKDGQIFVIPIIILIITQILKTVIDYHRKKRFKIAYLGHYGGMPSSHTALFTSLAAITYLNFGYKSAFFAIAFVICIIMIRDALGLRQHLGNHGLILKQLIEETRSDEHIEIKHEKIVTRLGHTPLQVAVGAVIGLSLTVIFYLLLN